MPGYLEYRPPRSFFKLLDHRQDRSLEALADNSLLREIILQEVLPRLSPKRRRVLELWLGMFEPALTHEEISRVMNYSREHIVCTKCMALTIVYRVFGKRLWPFLDDVKGSEDQPDEGSE